MRSRPKYNLTAALGKANLPSTMAVWGVVIDDDEISGYPSDLLAAGKFTKNISLLLGLPKRCVGSGQAVPFHKYSKPCSYVYGC